MLLLLKDILCIKDDKFFKAWHGMADQGIDPNTCRKSTSTIKSACRPNFNSSKQKNRDNHHNPQKLWQVLGDVLHRLPAKILPLINLLSFWLTDLWSSLQKNLKNTLNFLYFPEFATHHPRLSFPHVYVFLYSN